MAYKLGTASNRHLKGVHPKLVKTVKDAIKITPIDFTILKNGGVRTASEQMRLYKIGASSLNGRSRKSKHQIQESGYGEAVDLVPWVDGSPRWEWPLIYPIAAAMVKSAKKNKVRLRWGGVWDRYITDMFTGKESIDVIARSLKNEVYRYTVRHPGPDFIDGPHYEIIL